MALSSPGIGSGLDVNGIITQLMSLEAQPMALLDRKEASYQAKLSAYGSLQGALSSFQTTARGLNDPTKFNSINASSSDSAVATASASSVAVPGSYSIDVSQLAQSQKLVATGQSSTTASIGLGGTTTLTFDFGSISGTLDPYVPGTGLGGTYSAAAFTSNGSGTKTVTIDATNNSLSGVRDAINSAKIGVTASIINDGGTSPYRLVLASDTAGKNNSLKISVSGEAALSTLLGQDPAGTQNLQQTVVSQNTEMTVNGVFVSKASTTLTDVVQGVTLSALKIGTSTINVAADTAGVSTAVNAFIKGYNDLAKMLKDSSSYDPATKKAGILQGETSVRTIQSQMRALLGRPLTGGTYSNFSQIGITFQRDGSLALDSGKLQSALAASANDVAAVFSSTGKATDSLVNYVSSTASTKPGTYALTVSQLATQGISVGSAAAALRNVTGSSAAASLIIGPGNDTLNVTVDGVSAAVTLTAQTYASYAALATEVENQINTATGLSVTVTQNAGVMSITSDTATAASQVAVTGGNGVTNLLGAAPTQKAAITTGLNDTLSVMLNGVSATATLAAGAYTAANLAAEVQAKINGNSTLSSAGLTVAVTQSGGLMTLTSNSYGLTSNISITGNGISSLLGATPTSTAGFDVAGTINENTATGYGQNLTATTSNAEGLKVQVTGGAIGSRGTVSFLQGYAYQLDKLMDSFLGSSGTIASVTDGANRSIKDISAQKDVLNRRLQAVEARYRAQFTALDTMMASMTQTSNYLAQQLANLPTM